MHALISIHDVAPETLDRVQLILDQLPAVCRRNLTLLVIPGKAWSQQDLIRLRHWQEQGYALAGHGWSHRAERISSVYHRLHAWLISRDAAEHLALSRDQIVTLLHRNHEWFVSHGFSPPDFYVPPAWAMGAVTRADLAASPFRYFETGHGLYDARTSSSAWLPLAGFEADTRFRRHALTWWNRLNAFTGSDSHPLRIGIHPFDLELLLGDSMHSYLARVSITRHYRDVLPGPK